MYWEGTVRILMLAQFYPPTIGGEERHVLNLSIALAARGHDVAVATLWHEGLSEFEYDQGVRIYRIRGLMQRITALFTEKGRRYAPPFPDPESLSELRRIITRERPDIVHAHNWLVHSFTPVKAWSKAKLVVTLHDYSLVCVQKRSMFRGSLCHGPAISKCLLCAVDYYGVAKGVPTTLANWVYAGLERQTVDMFLPVSHAVAEGTQMVKHGVPHRVIPNFVPDDVDILSDTADEYVAQLPEKEYLLFVGDVRRDKGAEILLQAYAEIQSQILLVLIGKPEVGLSMNLPPNALLLQSWPHSAVMRAWSLCAIAVIPSVCPDACPTVAMEAMAMGRPIVASRIGGLSDIVIDGETGLLVPSNDWRALQDAIQRLLDDPALRNHLGAMAKQRVSEFQASTVVSRIEQVYQEVLQVRRQPSLTYSNS
jgi:glycosyltransferase involved in cell wall biosynthesis